MADWWQPLVGVTVGWILGQSTEWWRQKRRARQYRAAIYAELRDVHSTIKTRIEILKEVLSTYISKQTVKSFIADVDCRIFQAHFSELSLEFTESERLALVSIYKLVEHLNFNFSLIRSNWDIQSGIVESDAENLRKIVQVAEGSYFNARELDVMIELLLRDKEHHDIRDPHNVARLNRIASDVEAELRALLIDR
jgi:hypothetical protein